MYPAPYALIIVHHLCGAGRVDVDRMKNSVLIAGDRGVRYSTGAGHGRDHDPLDGDHRSDEGSQLAIGLLVVYLVITVILISLNPNHWAADRTHPVVTLVQHVRRSPALPGAWAVRISHRTLLLGYLNDTDTIHFQKSEVE